MERLIFGGCSYGTTRNYRSGASRARIRNRNSLRFHFVKGTGHPVPKDCVFLSLERPDCPDSHVRGDICRYGRGICAHDLGLVNLHIKPTLLGANILGGMIFGVGMLLLGF